MIATPLFSYREIGIKVYYVIENVTSTNSVPLIIKEKYLLCSSV
jgi:hypothetical protein